MRFVTGAAQSVKISSLHAVALIPNFFSSLPTLNPRVPFSTTSAVMPFSPFAGSVFTYTIAASATPPLVIHDFVPLITYASPFFGWRRRPIRTRLRLGERIAADLFSASVWHQEFLLLLFRSVTMYRIAIKRILHRKNHAGGGAAPRDLFNHNGVRDV